MTYLLHEVGILVESLLMLLYRLILRCPLTVVPIASWLLLCWVLGNWRGLLSVDHLLSLAWPSEEHCRELGEGEDDLLGTAILLGLRGSIVLVLGRLLLIAAPFLVHF